MVFFSVRKHVANIIIIFFKVNITSVVFVFSNDSLSLQDHLKNTPLNCFFIHHNNIIPYICNP